MTPGSMYRMVMGEAFDRLALPLQRFHSLAGHHTFEGWVEVHAPTTVPAKLLAALLGTPLNSAKGAIYFELLSEPGGESWTRVFPNNTMRSTLKGSGAQVIEHLGASRLEFELLEINGALEMRLNRLYFLGVPCPGWLKPKIRARETGQSDKLSFEIVASVPFIGQVASYSGYLLIPCENSP